MGIPKTMHGLANNVQQLCQSMLKPKGYPTLKRSQKHWVRVAQTPGKEYGEQHSHQSHQKLAGGLEIPEH